MIARSRLGIGPGRSSRLCGTPAPGGTMTEGTQGGPTGLRLREAGEALVVTFDGPKLSLDVREPLYQLIDVEGRRRLVLNFENVQVMSSAPIGVLFNLRKKAEAIGGAVRLCRLSPDLRQILGYAQADRLFEIFD